MGGTGTGTSIISTYPGSSLAATYVGGVIDDIRAEVNDPDSTRFTDATILSVLKKAIRRCNRIAQRNGLNFAKAYVTLTTVANQAYVSLPTDFDTAFGKKCLYRDSNHTQIIPMTEDEWETLVSSAALSYCLIDQTYNVIRLTGTPDAAENLTFWYYPIINMDAWTTSTIATDEMPWDGKLNDIIVEYSALRLKNLDEMDASIDLQLMTDLENQVLQAYAPLAPQIVDGKGWINSA